MLEQVVQFAQKKHRKQKRKFSNEPYFNHPKRVAEMVKTMGGSAAMIAAGFLHDTIEDTDTTYEEIKENFGGIIADLVQELTSDIKKIRKTGKALYLTEKMNQMSSEALLIKLCDRLDNVNDLRFPIPGNFIKQYSLETSFILNHLDRILEPEHQVLITKIRKKLQDLL